MSFVFKLNSLVSRIAILMTVLLMCGGLAWLILSHFILRAVTDPRLTMDRQALVAASIRFPDSPRVNYLLAESEMGSVASQEQMAADALAHAERAVNLSLWDFKARRLLSTLQEMNGDLDGAEKSLRAAVQLAPQHAEANWALANILVRRGKLDESLEPFRVANKSSDDFLSLTYELLWQSSGGKIDLLRSLAGNNPSAQLSLVQFFLDQSMATEALAIFRGMDRETKLNSTKSAEFIRSLMGKGQIELAHSLWLDLVSSLQTSPPSGGLIWNGGFESDAVKNFDHFDWTLAPSEYARMGIDTKVARTGSRSLKIAFAGRDTTKLVGEMKQLIVLRPGAHYHFECYAKAGDLMTPEGPRIAVLGQNGVIATSEPVAEGTTDWQRLTIDFIAPNDATPKYLAIVRIPKFSYDDPTRGVIWFDDFTLTE